jgi:SAM-dependent methyltransferase
MNEHGFSESVYLRMHDDVRLAVERGEIGSGYEHYQKYGRHEGRKLSQFSAETSHFLRDYSKLVRDLVAAHPGNRDLAMAKAIGALTLEIYADSGDKHVAILDRIGLKDGDAIYDLACGSGRTAMALKRRGWSGHYRGADIIPELIEYAQEQSPNYQFFVHHDFSINAPDATLDIIYAWSLYTHLHLEEIYLYSKDCHRALKDGGIFVFSFLTLNNAGHRALFKSRAMTIGTGVANAHLDTFLDKETIVTVLVDMLGFTLLEFIDADDATATPSGGFGQALAVFRK